MRAAAASTTCSQLSTSNSIRRRPRNARRRSRRSRVDGGAVHRHPKGVGYRDRDLVGGVDRCQPDSERAVGVIRLGTDDGGHCQGRLPRTAGPDQRQQPDPAQ